MSTTQPSWQATQRQGGIPAYQQKQGSYEGQAPQSWRASNAPLDSPTLQQQQQQQQHSFPTSQGRDSLPTTSSSSSGSGAATNSTAFPKSNTYSNRLSTIGLQRKDSTSPTPQQQQQQQQQQLDQQQQYHRRTQSLRPLSAFQPLEHINNGYQSGANNNSNNGRPSSPTGSVTRSIRTAAAPLTFKSPELRSALGLQEAQNKKVYMEGYLSRRDYLNAEGKPLNMNDPKKRWQLCFVQLSGTVLSVWSVQQMEEAARQGTEVPPSYINVTDCFVDFIGTITETPQEVPGTRGRYENVFAVNTAGQNRILFGVEGAVGRRLVQAWVNGIRLASWEKVRLEEIYTGSLVRARLGAVSAQQATSGPGGAPGDVEMTIKSPLSKGGRMEGFVKARFMGTTEWKKCWLVLSDKGAEGAAVTSDANAETASVVSQRSSFWSKLRGDRSSIIGAPSSTPSLADTGLSRVEVPPGNNGASGLACFYETKKTKKPFATLAYAAHAFAVYPSRPELVEGSSLFKVEGSFPLSTTVSATNRNRQTGWVMIMPELDGNTSKGANAEMMKWCIAFMDAFHLYGRPTQFQWDARNPLSPFFAYPIGPYKDRLFLDRELAEFLDIREERHLANRNNLHGIMSARMRGERTPILPPLPQPNVESTRNLNGPQVGSKVNNGSSSKSSNEGESSSSQAALPPLNFGQKDNQLNSSTGTGHPASNGSSGDAPPPPPQPMTLMGGLDPIGERSREGSIMTSLNTPISPATPSAERNLSIKEMQPNRDTKQPSDVDQGGSTATTNTTTTTTTHTGAAALGAATAGAGAAAVGLVNSRRERSNGDGGAREPSSRSSDKDVALPYLSPSANASAPPATLLDRGASPSSFQTADNITSSSPPVIAKSDIMATPSAATAPAPAISQLGVTTVPSQARSLQASGRGAEASGGSNTSSAITRKVSDPYGQYDEGALYFINSMGDQLPSISQSGNQIQSKNSNSRESAPLRAESVKSDQSTVYNPRSQATQPSLVTSQGIRPASMQAEGIDQDALAAYSFLDQPPSPNTSTATAAAAAAAPRANAAVPTINEPASTGQTPHAYPSTFGVNKKSQERKMAAQAQAQAHQDAMSKPGRVNAPKRGLKQVGGGQRHAWADEDSEDDDEEDDDDDEDASKDMKPEISTLASQPASRYEPSSQGDTTQRYSQASPMQQAGAQQLQPARYSMFNQHLGTQHDDNRLSNSSPQPTSFDSPQQRGTFVQLGQEEQPGAMTTAFQPHGLLQAGAQDKAERSAKQQEALARAEGTHMVNVDRKPPPPQAGLLGAITAHERDRKKEGGLGATLTERERDRVQAERRQREEDAMRMQQFQQQQQMMGGVAGQQQSPPGWGGMPFNPMMWQQMQMMQMMNPQMMMNPMFTGAAQSSGSQLGHSQSGHSGTPGVGGGGGGSIGGHVSPDVFAAQQQAQMMAAQAAQQAYLQAMSQHGGSMIGGEGAMPATSMGMPPMGMMPFNPYMSMYGGLQMPGYPGYTTPQGSDAGAAGAAATATSGPPPRMTASPSSVNRNGNSPLRR